MLLPCGSQVDLPYGDGTVTLRLPADREVSVYEPGALPGVADGEAEVRRAMAEPIAARPLGELARGRRSAAIVVDDATRPVPTPAMLRPVVDELRRAGLRYDQVTVVVATGLHRPLTNGEAAAVLGGLPLKLVNHDAYDPAPLVELGTTSRGTPLRVNRTVAEAEAWKANYGVFRIGRRLVVKPTWRDYDPQPNDLVIALDPGMAFGSGLHPTTRLCLESLEDFVHPQATALDVGTGAGILAIAAARLGASQVLALDTDPLAVRVARENVALNKVGPVVRVEEGSIQISNGKYQTANINSPGWDLVVANILAETIIEMAPALASSVVPEGVLVTSGIIDDRAKAVLTSLSENGLRLIERRDAGEWVALIAQKETNDVGRQE